MSSVDNDTRRAKQVTAARKKLNQFRAARTTTTPATGGSDQSTSSLPAGDVDSSSTSSTTAVVADATLPRRIPEPTALASPDVFDTDAELEISQPETVPKRHTRLASRHRRQQSSMSWPPSTGPNATRPSVMGFFDLPSLDHTDASSSSCSTKPDDSESLPREIVTTPATPPAERALLDDDPAEDRTAVKARLNTFSFGSKSSSPLLPSLPLRRRSPEPSASRPHSHHSALNLPEPAGGDEERSPRQRRRHSHNRSASISLPNLKLGRPTSLGLPSPKFPSTPSTPLGDAAWSSRHSTPKSGARLRFEPSDKEKEESRRRALEKLTGGSRREEPSKSITLPTFDEDEDEFSTSSSRPPSNALDSTASSSRPSSFTFPSATSSFNGSASGAPWQTGMEDTDRWSFGQRFEHPREESLGFGFELGAGPKTSSVLLNSNLGVLAEEDETEPEDREVDDVSPPTSEELEVANVSTPAAPTPSRLRELHLVSSVSTAGSSRRSSNPEALQAFARAAADPSPTKSYGQLGRNRPGSMTVEPRSTSGPRPLSMNSLAGRRPVMARSSISYKKDDSGSGSSRGAMSPPTAPADLVTSPTSSNSPLGDFSSFRNSRACPRPRSAIIGGTSGRVLGEVDEEAEDESGYRSFAAEDLTPSERSRDSYDGYSRRRDSRERIDAEMERDALREDVDLWRKRCRGLEDRLEAERQETALLRDRVRKLGDRLLKVSSATDSASPTEEHEAAQSRLIAEMRDQLFALTSALERERKDRTEAEARAADLQSALEAGRTPQVTPLTLPSTPKSRSYMSSATNVTATPPEAKYADAYGDGDLFADAAVDDDHAPQHAPPHNANDPNLTRMRGWGFPQGPVNTDSDRQNKRESFFGLSRPRAVHAPPSDAGLGLDWLNAPTPTEAGFDLPPFEINDANRTLVREVKREHLTRRQRPQAGDFSQTSATVTSPLSFLSSYLPLPRPPIPRVTITPSSVSPKKPLKHLQHYSSFVVPGCEVDFSHSCHSCTGKVIEL